jgi:hypothetical protein
MNHSWPLCYGYYVRCVVFASYLIHIRKSGLVQYLNDQMQEVIESDRG